VVDEPLQSKNTQKTLVLLSFLMLAGAMLLWPELYVFSKIMTIPDWANCLPSSVNTGAYLATLSPHSGSVGAGPV